MQRFIKRKSAAWERVYLKSFRQRKTPLAKRHIIPFRYWLFVLMISILMFLLAIFAFVFQYPESKEDNKNLTQNPSSDLAKEDFCLEHATSTIFAVLIDNEIHSRPPAGLSKAELVYEAPTEAGITRFLAVFCQIPHPIPRSRQVGTGIPVVENDLGTSPLKKGGGEEGDFPIGPVRSLRPYYLDWAEELGAPIIHVGGSPEAMARVKKSNIPDLDQYYNGGYFWRSLDRAAPHNVFTNLEKLAAFLNNRFPNFTSAHPLPLFKGEIPHSPPLLKGEIKGDLSVKSVSIDFIRPEHLVRWVYDENSNSYIRYQNGSEHKDVDGAKITAKNIIIQTTDIEIIDAIGRRRIRTTGEGKAMVFLDGQMIRGTWKRPTKDSLTRFYDLSGGEIKFNKGKIWVEIVADYHKISISN